MNDFQKFYQSKIQNKLKPLKIMKRKTLVRVILFIIIAGLFIGASFYLSKYSRKNFYYLPYLRLGLFAVGVLWIWPLVYFFKKAKIRFSKLFRELVIQKIVFFFDEHDLKYLREAYIPKQYFKESSLFNGTINEYSGSDYIFGKIKNTEVDLSQICAYEVKKTVVDLSEAFPELPSTENVSIKSPVFNGLFMTIGLCFQTQGDTYLFPKSGSKSQKKSGILFGLFNKLTEPEFEITLGKYNRFFRVTTTHPEEARKIFSDEVLYRIRRLRREILQEMFFSVKNSRLYIGIWGDKIFEPRFYKQLNYQNIKSYYEDLDFIFSIVEELDCLNEPF